MAWHGTAPYYIALHWSQCFNVCFTSLQAALLGEGKVAAIISVGFCLVAVLVGRLMCKFKPYVPKRDEDDDGAYSSTGTRLVVLQYDGWGNGLYHLSTLVLAFSI